ncbi:MAG: hypothetical protein H0W50_05685 [Parachlamydiaceae bacterium]|nr:hypothetical protein [Parachlamydiaceae bacterium]
MNKTTNHFISFIPTFVSLFTFLIPGLAYSTEIPTLKTLSHYDSLDRLCAIETVRTDIISDSDPENDFAESKETTFTEHIEWHPEFDHLITSKSMADEDGNTLISQTFHYDESGRLERETEWKWEDGPYYIQHEYFYEDETTRLKKTTIESGITVSSLTPTYGILDYIKAYFFPEVQYVQEIGDSSKKEPFGHYIWHLVDCGNYPLQSGTLVKKEANDKVRISFINGILNVKEDYHNSIEKISQGHGDTSIHYVCQPTEGLSWDILKSSLSKLGYTSPQAIAIAKIWKSLIAEIGGTESDGLVIHYAHSIGGTNTYSAKYLLTPEEQKMIKVITFGSPTIIPDQGFRSVTNYISVRDGITLLDPISRISAFFNDNAHIVYVGSYYGIPFIDHLLYGETYGEIITSHGKDFINQYYSSPPPPDL